VHLPKVLRRFQQWQQLNPSLERLAGENVL